MRAVLAAVVVLALGVAGLVRGAASSPSSAAAPDAGRIAVTNARVLPPAKGSTSTTATLTVYNTTRAADYLEDAITGAGSGAAVVNGPVKINAHSSATVRLSIEGVIGTLVDGQDVDVQLDFRTEGTLDVVAEVESVPMGAHS